MYNFDGSSKEEFAFASRFVMQKTVMMKMMIETSSYPPMKKLEVEAAVAKLMELPKGNEELSIECFWWEFVSSLYIASINYLLVLLKKKKNYLLVFSLLM